MVILEADWRDSTLVKRTCGSIKNFIWFPEPAEKLTTTITSVLGDQMSSCRSCRHQAHIHSAYICIQAFTHLHKICQDHPQQNVSHEGKSMGI